MLSSFAKEEKVTKCIKYFLMLHQNNDLQLNGWYLFSTSTESLERGQKTCHCGMGGKSCTEPNGGKQIKICRDFLNILSATEMRSIVHTIGI